MNYKERAQIAENKLQKTKEAISYFLMMAYTENMWTIPKRMQAEFEKLDKFGKE